ncbi:hypothetical protein N7478_002685 [Penicillium angulare]|uniref:uncharacterized protein n=1 Tax=Penicillium angulare TaxID=116970 RepID=UPI00253F894F|nr:uncharacterized protein N7478_002685 [Penicillium angulare]KAJ5286999.1 hypothetical protein N7478_002685 [Penicillium angulare]
MAEPPPESSHTPPVASLIDSTRSHGDSMEDSDPQATRKRPRLDSGSRVGESLSIDACATPAAVPASEMDLTPDSGRPSKVTINVKSPNIDMPSEKVAPPSKQPEQPHTTSQPPSPTPNTDIPDTTSPNVVSISSSPAQSPEIEVAELEDMDQYPNTGSWGPLEDALRDHATREVVEVHDTASLIDSFPRYREDQNSRDNLRRVILMMEKQDHREVKFLTAVKIWMDDCACSLDRLTPGAFVEDLEFWELLPSLVEAMMRRNQELPIDDGRGTWICLEEFLLDYIQITLHLLRIDIVSLRQAADEPESQGQEAVARGYLNSLAWSLQFQSIPFYRTLQNIYGEELDEFLTRLRAKAIALGVITDLAEYASLLIENSAKFSHWINTLIPIILALTSLIDCTLEPPRDSTGESRISAISETQHLKLIYDTIRLIDGKYQEWIVKKAPWLTSDVSEQLLRQIPRSFQSLLARDHEFVHHLSQDLSIELPEDADLTQQHLIITWGWKFRVLKKQIMEGRMELRAHGVETMQSELVLVWKQHISGHLTAVTSPSIQYLVHYIQDNKIVDYLVGVDSHPQLISRSSNIVGFLIVTSTYTNKETDIIWKTVTESQDSRFVSEVLSMLIRTFCLLPRDAPELLYACSKVLEFPLDRFDARVLEFCDSLLNQISQPTDHTAGSPHVDTIPLRICLRLIRESTAANSLSVDQKKQLQNFGSRHLERFIRLGISENDRMEMYERCIQDIADMNEFTAGSIQVLSALIPNDDSQEMRKLAEEFGLTRLVIKDLLHTVNSETDSSDGFSHHGIISRIALLFRLIDMAPDTITADLGKSFWNEILTSNKLGDDGYTAAWGLMVKTLSRSSKPNGFLDRCIHEYLPELSPTAYTPELLSFAKQSIGYDVRFHPPSPASEDGIVTIPGMERIWTFVLTALPGTIEAEVTKFAIEVYLDHPIIRTSPRRAVEATHISIVNRCIDQLQSTAATLRTPTGTDTDEGSMEQDLPSSSMGADEIKFRRSLLFLRQFLYGLRSRPHYSPPRGSPPRLPDRPLKGNPIEISWQSFGSSTSSVNKLEIGDLSTAAELMDKFTQLTGFSKMKVIWGGRRIDLLKEPETLVKDMKLSSGLLMIQKATDSQDVPRDNKRQILTTVDSEVLKHFDEIYELLSLKDDLAREIFDFLSVFPPQERITELFSSESQNNEALFPLSKPFVAFYSLNALQAKLREEVIEVNPEQTFVPHSIAILVELLMNAELLQSLKHNFLRLALATSSMECLLNAITVSRSEHDDSPLIQDAAPFVEHILSVIDIVRSIPATPATASCTQKLICTSFAVIVEGSTRDYKFWEAVKQHSQFDQLIHGLLLKECRQSIRNDVSERLKTICSPSKFHKQSAKLADDGVQSQTPVESPVRIDMLATIWNSLAQSMPDCLQYSTRSAEFFKVAIWIFRFVAEKSPRDIIFSRYLKEWSEIMLRHKTEEFVGREIVDDLILGFAVLVELCLDMANLANIELETFDLADQIMNKFLIPDLSMDDVEGPVTPRIPLQHSLTRLKLHNIVALLCKRSNESLNRTLKHLEDVVPRDVSYGPNSSYDRSKMIRAPEGYAGLKNLSNTCYLNSLMTQLFMNVEFRDFMLHLNLVDSQSSQTLLDETQKLFAWMQDTWTKSVDPQSFVESIRTYDNEAIDVTIQMDVDEFYNLLFDRWEAQIVDSKDKKKFRSFYGGQLVQQIKSKECSHISERLEPFSAIQCDIKGKAGLEDSLQAYVEGEIMQGDNKYSCTACGRHVDAVKRACLKDVPDNLIFHLKRFDFDMVTMTRSKINDEFQFPDKIDMTPYSVEHLSEPETPIEPDVFELVGVLVHTGTAESGHYYSYTRERPAAGVLPSWVEFNDSDVTRFDPSTIADQCFGGQGESMQGMGGVHINKVWNAYMLFYQRVSTMELSKQSYRPLKEDYPVRVPVPTEYANYIAMDNELFIRTYCLLDPCYTGLVQRLLERLRNTDAAYVHRPELELLAVEIGLDTFEQLIARTKEYQGADQICTEIYKLLSRNPHAAIQTLKWVSDRETSLRNIILRTSNSDIRQKGIMLIMGSLKRLRVALRDTDIDETERLRLQGEAERHVRRMLTMLLNLWPSIHTVPRAWEDYFDCFLKLADCGSEVIAMLLEKGVFALCLEVIWLDQEDKMELRHIYPHYTRMLEKGRRFIYTNMMILCAVFFKNIDFTTPPVPDATVRHPLPNGKYSLSEYESKYIFISEDDGSLAFLMKMFQHEQFGLQQSCLDIFATFVVAEPEARVLDRIVKTLEVGLRLSPADICAPFLGAAIVFCKHAPDDTEVINMIDFVAKGVDSINNSGGVDHLDFFRQLCTPNTVNERLSLNTEWFLSVVQQRIPDFVPTLLIDPERVVRLETLDLANRLLFATDSDEEMSEGPPSLNIMIGKQLGRACVEKVNRTFLTGQTASVESRLVYGITSTITHCVENYFDSNAEDEQEFVDQANDTLRLLDQITVHVPDEIVSVGLPESDMPSAEEWEATSALASDSEMGLAASP